MAFESYPVESSNLAAVEYDPDTLVLRVTFAHGGVYEYEGVLQEVVEDMVNADSAGSFFYRNIRMNYPYTKIN